MVQTKIKDGNPNCIHKFVKRDKKTIQILHRACTECGQEELHTEGDINDVEMKKIMKVN